MATRPRSPLPARCSTICATRRRPTSPMSAASRTRRRPIACFIDAVTLKHLEVVESMDGGRDGTLLHEIDRTVTPMAGPSAARLAAAAARVARSHSRPTGRRRRVRVPQYRPRQVSRSLEERAGPRASGRARGARQRNAARSRRPEAVDCRRAEGSPDPRRVPGAADAVAC